jgi:ornithine cyclodeaminase/alanine dehydrogenase-like protein (mu-crystallin family)
MLVLSRSEVEELLDPDELIEALASAMADLSAGAASMPSRIAATIPDRDAMLGAMPAYLASNDVLACKLVDVFPGNASMGMETHQAVVMCFDPKDGTPLALMDGTAVTAQRTAAGSALATRLLAREDARVLTIVGTGVQARAHADYVPRVRTFDEVRVVGRTPDRVTALATFLTAEGQEATAFDSVEEAVRGADVVCLCTHSPAPVISREWLADGAHVNSVGFNTEGPEVDAATVRDARVVVEYRPSSLAPPPAGPVDLQGLRPDDVVEIGEIILGTHPGRTSGEELTLYRSGGVAVQDAAAAGLVLTRARKLNVGREIEL